MSFAMWEEFVSLSSFALPQLIVGTAWSAAPEGFVVSRALHHLHKKTRVRQGLRFY
jgi:hypothetical protein